MAAYEKALEVYTWAQLPQDWARTQNNLGSALSELGIRMRGEEGRQKLSQAVAAYEEALEVRTKESLPRQWAQTHTNLAVTATALEDWEKAVISYRNVLGLYPDNVEVYLTTNGILHEKLLGLA